MNDILDEEEKEELLRLFSTVEIEIADHGRGIPEEQIAKLFVPFFTTKENGNGLGLPICKKIAILHKGDITVSSQVGEGTRFTITLPLYENYEEENPHR
jgi:signal transduction histidine kinase